MKKEYTNVPTSCIRLAKSTWRKIKMKAHKDKTTANKVVCEILEKYFKEK